MQHLMLMLQKNTTTKNSLFAGYVWSAHNSLICEPFIGVVSP